MKKIVMKRFFFCCLVTLMLATYSLLANAQSSVNIHQATLMETEQKTKEVSTEELRKILAEKSATVFDARPFKEYAISHIPGAVNVSAKAGVPISLYISDVAEIGRLLKGNKATPIVLYCNGTFCGKSKRLASELLEAGYTNVRRYQLGIPVWRALGGVTQIEPEGIRYVLENDRTAVFIDAREPSEFKADSIPQARNIPRNLLKPGKDVGEIKAAKDNGRLPMEDHNTRIIVFGKTAEQARAVAEAIAGEAFHNVSFFDGSFEELRSASQTKSSGLKTSQETTCIEQSTVSVLKTPENAVIELPLDACVRSLRERNVEGVLNQFAEDAIVRSSGRKARQSTRSG